MFCQMSVFINSPKVQFSKCFSGILLFRGSCNRPFYNEICFVEENSRHFFWALKIFGNRERCLIDSQRNIADLIIDVARLDIIFLLDHVFSVTGLGNPAFVPFFHIEFFHFH